MVLDIFILLEEDVTNTVCGLDPILLNLDTHFIIVPDYHFLAILFIMFTMKAKTVSICLSDSQPLEHWENDEISFQNARATLSTVECHLYLGFVYTRLH